MPINAIMTIGLVVTAGFVAILMKAYVYNEEKIDEVLTDVIDGAVDGDAVRAEDPARNNRFQRVYQKIMPKIKILVRRSFCPIRISC